MGQLGKQPSFPLFPETPNSFFLKVVDAQIEVVKDPGGAVTALILHQGGRDQTMTRKSATVEPPPGRKEIPVSREILERYVGAYRLSPNVDILVTLDDSRLGVQLTGQQRFPIFPEAENKFFLKVVDAQLEFVPGDGGGRRRGKVGHPSPERDGPERTPGMTYPPRADRFGRCTPRHRQPRSRRDW
jgi:hypothetical protein